MKSIIDSLTKNTFVTGLWAALSVVIADFLNAYIINPSEPISWQAFAVAAAIVAVGYIGTFLTGAANTVVSMIGSAVIAIVPLLITGHINWALVAAAFAIKLLGLKSEGKSTSEGTSVKLPYTPPKNDNR